MYWVMYASLEGCECGMEAWGGAAAAESTHADRRTPIEIQKSFELWKWGKATRKGFLSRALDRKTSESASPSCAQGFKVSFQKTYRTALKPNLPLLQTSCSEQIWAMIFQQLSLRAWVKKTNRICFLCNSVDTCIWNYHFPAFLLSMC